MGFWRFATGAVAMCAGAALAGCTTQPPAAETSVSPAVAATPPAAVANWQWSDAGPAVILHATDITSAGNPTASLSLVCDNAIPTIDVSWDAPVASAGLSYRFAGQPSHDVGAVAAGPRTQIVSDPLVVSRFIDEAAASRQLVLRAGARQASFVTTDHAGNLRRFRSLCPDGTN